MGKNKNKEKKPNESAKSTDQANSSSNPKLNVYQKRNEEKQQQKQTEQLFSMKSNKGKKKDWTCDKCNKVNFAKRVVCKFCNEPKPGPPEVSKEQYEQELSEEQKLSDELIIAIPSESETCKIETSLNAKQLYEGTKGRLCKVEVNYLKLNLTNLSKTCYQYDITFIPDTPKKMLPSALGEFMKKWFQGYYYGFDGKKIMITNKKLTMTNSKDDEFADKIEVYFGNRNRSFEIKAKLVSVDDMEVLKNYKNDGKITKANQNLDIILKCAFRSLIESGKAVRGGRNLYFPKERNDLGEGMELWQGLFQSTILGRTNIYLNVDVQHKAFPATVHLLDYLKKFDRNHQIPKFLNDGSKKKLFSFLKTLTIGYRLNQSDPILTYSFNAIGEPASKSCFEYNGKNITVKDYFKNEKNIELKFPDLPVLWVGSRTKKILLPMEFCEIPPGQVINKTCSKFVNSSLITFSVTRPQIRKEKIHRLLDEIPYNSDCTIKDFGIEVPKTFQIIKARVIDSPNLKYKYDSVKPLNGTWNDVDFIEVDTNPIKWFILNGSYNVNGNDLKKFKNDLIAEAKKQKIILEDFRVGDIINMDLAGNKSNVEQQLMDLKKSGYKLVVPILTNDRDYQVVKKTSELCVGILTTCIKDKTILKMQPGATVKNILRKLNAKLNGKNHEIDESSFNAITADDGTMFIGADVTHPTKDQRNNPSFVGVVSSYDKVGTKYTSAWRSQERGEMIQDLESIIIKHIKSYRDFNDTLPKRIMYYRDGVSDGEFQKVLDIELTAIRKAMTTIYGQNKPAEITFIVVQKRHQTRFFPTDKKFSDKNGNILPGTVVDSDIVHPFQFEFFMASHTAIKGVTKPSKYCILVNESNLSADNIQAITYDLCHLFSRCSRAVSYPAPTYYAHHAAARGKNYFDEKDMADMVADIGRANEKYQNNGINQKFINEYPMYFI